MRHYVILESRDPFESRDTDFVKTTVQALKKDGADVTVFLLQNGAFASRKNARTNYLPQLAEAGAKLLVDQFSLEERSIKKDEIHTFLGISSMDELVDLLLQPETKAIWH